ncbi:MAG: arginine--tRNA ligase [Mycoplasmoidaceae bacterium]|nr:arginine--tRNA ligase [Mycoplasmoidaceae bacterium]
MSLKNESIVTFIREEVFKAIKAYCKLYKVTTMTMKETDINVDKARNSKFGDFTTNVVMSLQLGNISKVEVAKDIAHLIDKNAFSKIEVAGPGFINFYLNDFSRKELLSSIDAQGKKYGKQKSKKLWYNIEFVSANPTGLLHIGHARNGAYGDSLARIFEANGIKVDREYYINDGGNQINKLALSVLIRYLQSFGKKVELPEDSYHASEIVDTANLLKEKYGDKFVDVKFDQNKILDEDANKDIGNFSKKHLLGIIKDHLEKLDVKMDL